MTQVAVGAADEAVSPELALVCPELRERLLPELPLPGSFAQRREGVQQRGFALGSALVYTLYASGRTLLLALSVAASFAIVAVIAQLK